MRINIPVKLNKYKDHIKTSCVQISYKDKLVFEKIGSLKKNDTYRELYILYNPYDINIKFDINYFNKEKNVYKLYPAIVDAKPKEFYAFMVFSTKQLELKFDNEILIYNHKTRINKLIKSLNEKNNIVDFKTIVEDYNVDINSTIVLDESIESIKPKELKEKQQVKVNKVDVDRTQHLGKLLKERKGNVDYKEYDKETNEIKFKLNKILFNKNKYEFVINFINSNKEISYKFNEINLTLSDKKIKKNINIKHSVKLKNYSMKNLSFFIEEKLLKDFMINDIKIDVDVN